MAERAGEQFRVVASLRDENEKLWAENAALSIKLAALSDLERKVSEMFHWIQINRA